MDSMIHKENSMSLFSKLGYSKNGLPATHLQDQFDSLLSRADEAGASLVASLVPKFQRTK